MANIKSQKKRIKTNAKRAERNKAARSELKTRVKTAVATAGTEDGVDHAGGKAITKGGEEGAEEEDAVPGGFEDNGIPHDQRRDQGGEGFVEGIIEGAEAQRNA